MLPRLDQVNRSSSGVWRKHNFDIKFRASMILDFARISGPRSSKQENFEALVSQLLTLEFQAQALDGAGGDSGIDCFLRSPSGELTIFQAKYFLPRIGKSQRNQIKNSFHRATQSEGLIRWVLCIPINPTEGELDWFLGLRANGILMEWWGIDRLEALLSRHNSLCRSFFPMDSLEEEFERFRETVEATLKALGSAVPNLGVVSRSRPSKASLRNYLARAQDVGRSLSYDDGIITSTSNPLVAIDTSDIYAYLSSGTGFGLAESLIDFGIRMSPFRLEIPPPFMVEVVRLLSAIAADAQGHPEVVLAAEGNLELLEKFVRLYETSPSSAETRRVYRQVLKLGRVEGAVRAVNGIPKLQSAINSGRIAVSVDSEWKDVDRAEFQKILGEFQITRKGRAVHNYVDALALSLIKRKFDEDPGSIRVISSAHSFKRAAERILGEAHPVRTARDFAFLLSAKEAEIGGLEVSEAAESLGQVASQLVDLDGFQLSGLEKDERRALLESFDSFLPVYRELLWPIDELIVAESRSSDLRESLWEMDEFYRVLVGEAEVVKGFRLWWERACARIDLLRNDFPGELEDEVAELVSSLAPNPGN